jgi:hypothetical protein
MAHKTFSWVCPYCRQTATVTESNTNHSQHTFENHNKLGPLGLLTAVVVCPNENCREFTINAGLFRCSNEVDDYGRPFGDPIERWKLRPRSAAKPFPDYIPAPILQDYQEACLTCDLSPKASATLSRRCLQGMIRNFWGISKSNLFAEILELQGKVDITTWSAIDAVRSIGNIGAHMEKDINVIVDVEPEEAELLIGLIESLLEEWYVHRHERDEHMKKIVAAAQAKATQKAIAAQPPSQAQP